MDDREMEAAAKAMAPALTENILAMIEGRPCDEAMLAYCARQQGMTVEQFRTHLRETFDPNRAPSPAEIAAEAKRARKAAKRARIQQKSEKCL